MMQSFYIFPHNCIFVGGVNLVKDDSSEDFCPDILGRITKSDKRFEYNGVQFVGGIYPGEIASGERTYIAFILQSALDTLLL